MAFRDCVEFRYGSSNEQAIVKLLYKEGWGTLPNYDLAGSNGEKAPKLKLPGGKNLILPDIQCFNKNKQKKLVECKTKERASHTHRTGQDEFGLDTKYYEHYKAVQEYMGDPVELFIYEMATQTLFFSTLDELQFREEFVKTRSRTKYINKKSLTIIPVNTEELLFPKYFSNKIQWMEAIEDHPALFRGDVILTNKYNDEVRGRKNFTRIREEKYTDKALLGEWVTDPDETLSVNDPLDAQRGYVYYEI